MTPSDTKVLFILKRREDYNAMIHSHVGLSTGLYNSASYVCEMLNESGVSAALEVAIDNNCIDRLVTKHRPRFVIIEALWVVPEKFDVLAKLHPDVTWVIRLHSELPFLAGEGMAMRWVAAYMRNPNIVLAANAPRALREVRRYLASSMCWRNGEEDRRVIYLPNFYPKDAQHKRLHKDRYWVDVACFGAVRPLKNHLVQAVAALDFAHKVRKQLRFHINGGRVEMKGDPVMHNLQGMFDAMSDYGHKLVLHQWMPREEFLDTCAQMDLGLQVSFSETFNIVGADLISQGVPLVGTSEIPWSVDWFNADPTDSKSITCAMMRAYTFPTLNVKMNKASLNRYAERTRAVWAAYFRRG